MNTLEKLLPKNGNILFACIGTDRSTGDSLGPLVGTMLEEKGYHVIGTLDYPLHAINLAERVEQAKKDFPEHFIVAIDACLGKMEDIGKVIVEKGSIKPGLAVKKELLHVGDVAIKGIVNVGGFQEYRVLQNTRLGLVWNMAKEVVEICDNALKVQQVFSKWSLYQEEALLEQAYQIAKRGEEE